MAALLIAVGDVPQNLRQKPSPSDKPFGSHVDSPLWMAVVKDGESYKESGSVV
jgi:hypothetical protein